jgi:hypothetical protein
VFHLTSDRMLFHHNSFEYDHLCYSGHEQLYKSLKMKSEHYKVIDEYIGLKREDIHSFKTSEAMAKFSKLHDRVTKVISLYLHTSDAAEVMKKQEQIARHLVEHTWSNEDANESTNEHKKRKLILSTFKHLSTRYIDGISFSKMSHEK